MEEYFASLPLTNSSVLCVGGITRNEADRAREEGLPIDGVGYYIYLANEAVPQQPIEILAKVVSNGAAERLARLIGTRRL